MEVKSLVIDEFIKNNQNTINKLSSLKEPIPMRIYGVIDEPYPIFIGKDYYFGMMMS